MPSSVALLPNTVRCVLMNVLCRIAGIDRAITEMRADCLYLAGKRCTNLAEETQWRELINM